MGGCSHRNVYEITGGGVTALLCRDPGCGKWSMRELGWHADGLTEEEGNR